MGSVFGMFGGFGAEILALNSAKLPFATLPASADANSDVFE